MPDRSPLTQLLGVVFLVLAELVSARATRDPTTHHRSLPPLAGSSWDRVRALADSLASAGQ